MSGGKPLLTRAEAAQKAPRNAAETLYDMDFYEAPQCLIRGVVSAEPRGVAMFDRAYGRALRLDTIAPDDRLPQSAPELFKPRAPPTGMTRREDAIEFLERVWGPFIKAGVLHQDDFARLGESVLLPALRALCQRRGLSARDYLPPPRHIRTDELEALEAQAPGATPPALLAHRIADRERLRRRNGKPTKT